MANLISKFEYFSSLKLLLYNLILMTQANISPVKRRWLYLWDKRTQARFRIKK